MVKTYILAPNWTTAPPPKGPIKLGHLLDDLTEFTPLNRLNVPDMPKEYVNPVHTQKGFKTSRGRLLSGELGLFARILGLVGVGGGAEISYKKDSSDILSCTTLETQTFDPPSSYILDSMGLPEVKMFMEGANFKEPVYMVTGLKIGRGASLKSSAGSEKGVKMDGGLNPPGSPAQVGGKFKLESKTTEGESWTHASDFIVAFRVRKIWYDRKGTVKNEAHNKNVVMQDGTPAMGGGAEGEMELCVNDEVGVGEMEGLGFAGGELSVQGETEEDGEEVRWIIPNVEEVKE